VSAGEPSAPPALTVNGLYKAFPGVQALLDVDFEVRIGEVHGLVGENGAGKSTLVKSITGAHPPDAGAILAFGEKLARGDPAAHQRAGIAAIYQELTIVPEMNAAANVFLGMPKRWGPFVSLSATRRAFRDLAEQLSVTIDPNATAGSLSVATQQMLEIMRALAERRRILIMDEPTSSLGPAERRKLYEIIARLRTDGVAIIYISHDLDEVLSHCDRVSVMRDGELVATRPVAGWTKDTLVHAMLGHVLLKPPERKRAIHDEEALRVENLTVPGAVSGVSFVLRRGEILGIAGLVGSGRTELLRAIAGADVGAEGRLFVRGREYPWPKTVRNALSLGIALAPEDRKAQGLVLGLAAATNITLTDMATVAVGPFLSKRKQISSAVEVTRPLGFDGSRLDEPAETFSGGNQQKLMVAKWLHRRPDVLLMDEFTRGIDVGAKAEMLEVLTHLADAGMSLVIVSSELEEVVEAADRVLVLVRGQLVATLERHEVSVERILRLVFMVEDEMTATRGPA
jgi:ABC-type sugar transport system ATPase subunit